MTERVVLAYSGGLDTSVAIGWIAEETGAEVIAVAVDVGQGGEDLDVIRERALACGAVESRGRSTRGTSSPTTTACRRCRPTRSTWTATRWSRRCPGRSSSSTSSTAARSTARSIVAHGCTGKGNDQVRFEVGIGALAPDLQVHRPGARLRHDPRQGDRVRRGERPADRRDQEVAVLDRPERVGPRGRDRLPRGHLERPDRGRLRVHRRTRRCRATPTRSSSPSTQGVPVAIDGQPVTMLQADRASSTARAGAQGVGRLDMVEDRLVGIKSREVYEAPGRDRADHRAPGAGERHRRARPGPVQARRRPALGRAGLRRPVVLAAEARARRASSTRRSSTSPATIRMTLHGGRAVVTGRRSEAVALRLQPGHLRHRRHFDQSLAKGFVELWGLPSRIAAAPRPAAPRRSSMTDATAATAGSASAASRCGSGAGGSRAGRPRRWRGCRVSVHFDWRLAPYDLAASRAHARVLHRAGPARRRRARPDARRARRPGGRRARPARSAPTVDDEDVHTALERGLLERLGALGGKLRAGRSRNDQVATDLRLYLRDHARALVAPAVVELADGAGRAGRAARRHRRAGHDPPAARPAGAASATSCSRTCTPSPATSTGCATGTAGPRCRPLGAGALAGSSLPLDPEAVAAELGFARAVRQLDRRGRPTATSSPSSCFVAALIGRAPVPARRGGRASGRRTEFGWVELDDAFATGSSIMPQKKNPDVAELARGKSGRLIGDLTGAADHAQGPAARLRPRPAGGQGAGLRRGRHAAARAARR